MVAVTAKSTTKPSVRDNWATPQAVVDAVEQHLRVRFVIDVCATGETKKCPEYYGPELGIDGLAVEWGAFNWCNPPFSNKLSWLEKAKKEALERSAITAFLTAEDSGTAFTKDLENASDLILKPNRRIAFIDENGRIQSSPPFYSIIAIITPWAKSGEIRQRRIEI